MTKKEKRMVKRSCKREPKNSKSDVSPKTLYSVCRTSSSFDVYGRIEGNRTWGFSISKNDPIGDLLNMRKPIRGALDYIRTGIEIPPHKKEYGKFTIYDTPEFLEVSEEDWFFSIDKNRIESDIVRVDDLMMGALNFLLDNIYYLEKSMEPYENFTAFMATNRGEIMCASGTVELPEFNIENGLEEVGIQSHDT
jgi:hypothetical protein